MVKNLIRCLLLILTCLGGYFGLETKVGVQQAAPQHACGEVRPCRPIGQDRLWAEEPSNPLSAITRRPVRSQQLGSTRTSRLLPTQGSKSGHSYSRLASGHLSHLLKYLPQLQICSHPWLSVAATSPRRHYIIALRRLLC